MRLVSSGRLTGMDTSRSESLDLQLLCLPRSVAAAAAGATLAEVVSFTLVDVADSQ
jgi:hypothetical protein